MVDSLIRKSAEAGVFLFVEDGELRFKLSVDEFPEPLKQEIIQHKPEIIEYLASLDNATAPSEQYRIVPTEHSGKKMPVSFAQQRLWFIDAMEEGSAGYHISGAFSVTGEFDESLAERALQQIVLRHEALRTTFSHDGEKVWQQVSEQVSFHLERLSVIDIPSAEQPDAINRKIQDISDQPFDLASDMMLRACFIRQSSKQGVLQFTLHHIATDGWSMNVLMSEFASLYEAMSQQGATFTDPLPAPAIQYIDYALWQQSFLQSDAFTAQLGYWKNQLADLPPVNSLPLDHPRKPIQTKRGAHLIRYCDAESTAKLRQLATDQGVTLFMLLQSVFALLIARHSQNGDVVMGTPIANRVNKETEALVGFFANTLVLRTDCTQNQPFSAFLQQSKAVHIEAQSHQDVPFDYLVEVLNPVRSTSHDPVFQILFSMNTVAEPGGGPGPWQLKRLTPEVTSANFEITLDVHQKDDELECHFIYNSDLFNDETIERFANHYRVLLDAVSDNPDQLILQLPLLTDAEVAQLHSISEEVVPDLPGLSLSAFENQCIHRLFEEQALKSPDAIALVRGNQSLSYQELNRRANRLAHYLMEQGVSLETPVGICLCRTVDLIVSLLAVMKAGGAYVPLDPTYPQQRLQNIIESSGLGIVLTQATSRPEFDSNKLVLVEVNTLTGALNDYTTENPVLERLGGQHLAYVIYTSGSTGVPKGVEIEHRNACAMLGWARSVYSYTELERTLASTSINFDLSVFEIFLPLSIGASVVLVDNILTLIEQDLAPTLINTVPSGIAALLDANRVPSSAGTVNLAGEPLPEATVNALLESTQCGRVVNLYGPSEDTTYSTMAEFTEPTDKVTIGRPIYHSQAYILDTHLQPVPKGTVGELYLGGAGVARGYRNRQDLTAERFIVSPLKPDSRLYKTGDLVRWLPDNTIDYLGRADDQVKIRGFRIELEDINQQLLQHEDVKSAAVVVREDDAVSRYIAAYVTLENQSDDSESRLEAYLKQALPDYMVPSAFVVLDKMPLTANGKIDKRALPTPVRAQAAESYSAPESQTEKTLALIWSELFRLPVERISRHNTFFELGGHSLLTIRLLSLIASKMETDLTIRDVFEHSSLAQLAARIDHRGGARILKPDITALPREYQWNEQTLVKEAAFPVSFAQQRLWFVDQLAGGSAHYNIPSALRVQGAFDLNAAETALQRIVARHEPLRTVFRQRGEGAEQVIRADAPFTLARTDLSGLPEAEQEAAVQAEVDADALHPFDLQQDVLLRARFLHLADHDGVLLFTMHHIVSDGWSMGVLVDEFITQYEAVQAGQPDPLPPLGMQYADFAHWQRHYLQGEVREQQLSFWRETLAELPPVHSLPLDYPRPAEAGQQGGHATVTVAPETTQALKQIAQQHNATLFMVLHAALTLWLSRHSHSQDIVLGTPVANRLDAQLQSLVGFFVNSLVLRTQVPEADCAFADYLAQVRTVNLDAQAHQDVPFELLVDDLKPERTPQYAPLFQIMFSMNTNQASERTLAGLTLSQIESEAITAKFDLIVAVDEGDDEELTVTLEYNRDLWRSETVEAMADRYGVLLHSIAEHKDAYLSDLDLLTDTERQQLLYAHNDTRTDYPREATLPSLFATQVQQHPDRIAARYGDSTLTYAELNARANRVAHRLMAEGIEQGSLVGLYVDRSLDMLVGMLAILKAGAAYVPLDTSYPEDRLAYMVQDSGVNWVLTQSHLPSLTVEHRLMLDEWPHGGIDANPDVAIQPTDRAYVIYTSGSTGQPKGVAVTHRNVVRLIQPGDYPILETDVVAQASNHAFDAATFEVWGALTNGAQLVGLNKTDLLEPAGLRQLLARHRISVLFLTTSLFHQVARLAPETFADLRLMIFGGEAVDKPCLDLVLAQGKPTHLVNGYGPTENTTFSTYFEVNQIEPESYPIGFPVRQSSVYILDSLGQPVPKGCIGELYVGGDGVAEGYWQRPELSAERFIANPFSDDSAERLYRTGDLVRMRADGALVFVGRVDSQIKLRGFRIELGEIEQRLMAQPGIDSAVVLLREDTPGQTYLCAYVVSDHDDGTLRSRVREALQAELPDYMVPSAIEPLAKLPLTDNGKVDHKALPVPTLAENTPGDYQPPETETERQLVTLWADLLGRTPEQIGVTDNFFELGGDSILSIQLVSRALQQGLQLSVRQLFANQTIRRLAPHVTEGQGIDAPQHDITGAMPLLPIQRQFLDEGGNLQHFNQSVLLRIPSDLSLDQLKAVVQHWYQRHDALRLRFQQTSTGEWQADHAPLDDAMLADSWEQITYQHEDQLTQDAQHRQRSLDIQSGPLFKAVHYIPADGHHDGYRLLLVAHHLVVDGVSWRVLLSDAERLLTQSMNGQPLQLAPKSSSYQQWGQWLQDYAHSDVFQPQRAYWHQQVEALRTDAANLLTADKSECRHGDAGHVALEWTAEQTKALLSQAGSAYRTQINELLLSALLLGLNRWSGRSRVLIDLESHGRDALDDRLDLSQTVGWFTTVYPLSLSLPDTGNTDFGALIGEVKRQYRAVPEHGLGYGLLKSLVGDPVLATAPYAPVVFNYLGQFDQVMNDESLFGVAPEPRGDDISPDRPMSHALNFNGLVADGCLSFDLAYDPTQFQAEEIAALAEQVERSVTDLISHCLDPESSSVSHLDFPLAQVTDAVLRDWPHQLNCRPRDLEDLYPATPMQSGLLFHSLLSRSAYVTQLSLTFAGDLDEAAFHQAWRTVQQRHAIFRTAFVGAETGQLHQAVLQNPPLPWHSEDLQSLTHAAQQNRIEAYRQAEYEAGFELTRTPLMRIALFRTTDASGRPQTQLLWSHHHALSDGWCLGLIFSELQAAYTAALAGNTAKLPSVTPYREYIAWLQRQDRASAESYWQQVLADIEGPTALPGARQNPQQPQSSAFDRHYISLNTQASEALSALARRSQTTVNTLLQAAWAYVLACYSGDDQVVFGTTVSGRPADLPGVENMVGLFINTLPVVAGVSGEMRIEDWLHTLHQQQSERDAYSFVPLADLQRQSGLNPLFESLLVFENYPVDRLTEADEDDAALRVVDSQSVEATNYPLSITASLSEVLQLKLTYQCAALTEEQVARLGEQLLRVLRQLSDVERVRDLTLLSEEEQHQTLAALRAPAVPYPADVCLHEQIENQAARTPQALAVVGDDGRLTYGELNARANQLARALRARGVQPDTLVGLSATRTSAMLVGLLGILKAGGAYVPIDPAYPAARKAHLLSDSGISVLVTAGVASDEPADNVREVVSLDSTEIQQELSGYAETNPGRVEGQGPENLAYVIYTSGSTGMPKGVMVEHHSLMNLACWMKTAADHQLGRECQHWALNAPVAFDSSLKVITQLAFGRTLYLLNEDIRLQPDALLGYFNEHRIDVADITPSLLELLLTSAEQTDTRLPHLLIGGEAISNDLWQRLAGYGQRHQRTFLNVYGPTEATVDTSYAVIGADDEPNIGQPVHNVQVAILDAHNKPVPAGYPGELHIAGVGLARGYLNQPELTGQTFIKLALDGENDVRLYKTGDKVRLNNKGALVYLGRIDNQAKIRGYRVEPEEVSQQLLDGERISAAHTLVYQPQGGDKQLVSYVVPADPSLPQAALVSTLREKLQQTLPEFMVPSIIMVIDRMPLTQNGKVNRQALPEPDASLTSTYEPPETLLETQLVTIWAEILSVNTEKVSVQQNLFEMGAHSLLLLKALSTMKQQGIEASLKQIYENPTIRMFAGSVQTQQSQKRSSNCVIRLNQCKDGHPLFIFHPYGGRCDGYAPLAKALEQVCPVYGVQAPFNDHQSFMFNQFEALCDFYIEAIKHYQPKGPYHIAGWSAGGNIAAMVAKRLSESGCSVQRLFIMDAMLEREAITEKTDHEHLMDVLKIELQDEDNPEGYAALPEELLESLGNQPIEHQVSLVATHLATIAPDTHFMDANQIAMGLRFGMDFNKVDRSVPEFSITGKSVLICASENPPELRKSIFEGWLHTVKARSCESYDVKSPHHLMMRGEAVARIGQILKLEMRQLQNETLT